MCEHCGKAFEAKTVTTRFCSEASNNASIRQREYDNADLYNDTETAQAEQKERSQQNLIESTS